MEVLIHNCPPHEKKQNIQSSPAEQIPAGNIKWCKYGERDQDMCSLNIPTLSPSLIEIINQSNHVNQVKSWDKMVAGKN